MRHYNYELLETARQLRQLTQKEAAKRIGISQASLSKAERGLQELPDSTMKDLSNCYDLPIDFFINRNTLPLPAHLYFRRKLTISDKIINSFVAKGQIFKMIVDNIMSTVELPVYNLESYAPDEDLSPKDIAEKTRYNMGISYGPVPNLSTLLELHGIIVIRFDFGTDKIDGLTTVTNSNRKIMFINKQMPNDRIRFSMAHELGHLIMHISFSPRDLDRAEDEADEFASEFLMPEKEIKSSLIPLNTHILGLLKRRWRVSMRALIRRAKDLECISYKQYRNFQIMFSKKGWNKYEPNPIPVETPSLLHDTIELYKTELGYNDNDLMQIMHIREKDFHNWFDVHPKVVPLHIKSMIK